MCVQDRAASHVDTAINFSLERDTIRKRFTGRTSQLPFHPDPSLATSAVHYPRPSPPALPPCSLLPLCLLPPKLTSLLLLLPPHGQSQEDLVRERSCDELLAREATDALAKGGKQRISVHFSWLRRAAKEKGKKHLQEPFEVNVGLLRVEAPPEVVDSVLERRVLSDQLEQPAMKRKDGT